MQECAIKIQNFSQFLNFIMSRSSFTSADEEEGDGGTGKLKEHCHLRL